MSGDRDANRKPVGLTVTQPSWQASLDTYNPSRDYEVCREPEGSAANTASGLDVVGEDIDILAFTPDKALEFIYRVVDDAFFGAVVSNLPNVADDLPTRLKKIQESAKAVAKTFGPNVDVHFRNVEGQEYILFRAKNGFKRATRRKLLEIMRATSVDANAPKFDPKKVSKVGVPANHAGMVQFSGASKGGSVGAAIKNTPPGIRGPIIMIAWNGFVDGYKLVMEDRLTFINLGVSISTSVAKDLIAGVIARVAIYGLASLTVAGAVTIGTLAGGLAVAVIVGWALNELDERAKITKTLTEWANSGADWVEAKVDEGMRFWGWLNTYEGAIWFMRGLSGGGGL